MSDKEAWPSPSPPSKNDVNPDGEIKKTEEEKQKICEAIRASAAVEVYNPLFVPSVPPGIVSKKFKLDPEKWKRGYGSVFPNSHKLHTSELCPAETLFVKHDDEQSRLADTTSLSSIFAKQSRSEFRYLKDIIRKMRKYVMSKSVYKRCIAQEKKIQLQNEHDKMMKQQEIEQKEMQEKKENEKMKAFEDMMTEHIKRYVQFAPSDLCTPLRKGVCLWYKMVVFAKCHEYSATKEYVEVQSACLRQLYDKNNFDVDFRFYLGTLHVLFTSSNLYRRFFDITQILEARRNKKTVKARDKTKTDGTSIIQVFDLVDRQQPQKEDHQHEEPVGQEQPSSMTNHGQISLANEMSQLYKQIECSNETLQLVPYGELMFADEYVQEAVELYRDFLQRKDSDSTQRTEDLGHDLKQIHRRWNRWRQVQWEFIDFFRQVMTITLTTIAVDEDSAGWDMKTVQILAALLEGPEGSPTEIDEQQTDRKPSRVELAFEDVPEELMKERLGETFKEMGELLRAMTVSEEEHRDKGMQEAVNVYTHYLQHKTIDEDCMSAMQVVDELKRIFEEIGTNDKGMKFFDFFELVQNVALTLIDDFEEWDAKTLKVLVVLLNGPVSEQRHMNADVDHTQEFKEQRGGGTNIEYVKLAQ